MPFLIFLVGIICGPHRGSFPVRDHLRSNLGIICGPGSFAVLGSFAVPYSRPLALRGHVTNASLKQPCIRLARGKFELTNQDSASGKKSSVLTSSKQVRKGFEIRQLFSLKMALNIHEKGFTISKTIPVCKK